MCNLVFFGRESERLNESIVHWFRPIHGGLPDRAFRGSTRRRASAEQVANIEAAAVVGDSSPIALMAFKQPMVLVVSRQKDHNILELSSSCAPVQLDSELACLLACFTVLFVLVAIVVVLDVELFLSHGYLFGFPRPECDQIRLIQ